MMLFSRQQRVDDDTLKGYLFGQLPPEETERLDELSVVDDEFAARLDTVEREWHLPRASLPSRIGRRWTGQLQQNRQIRHGWGCLRFPG
jgi:hypothetical protein